jgi:hypothetical protein
VLLQRSPFQSVVKLSTSIVAVGLAAAAFYAWFAFPNPEVKGVVRSTAKYDTSLPLRDMVAREAEDATGCAGEKGGCGVSPPDSDGQFDLQRAIRPASMHSAAGGSIEQTVPGSRPPMAKVESFDGLGFGFTGPQGTARMRNPSDNTLAVGPNHIVQIVNSRMAVFSKKGAQFGQTGKVLYGPVRTNTIFEGFGGQCETQTSGDSVVRYDQLAERWLYVLPIFRRPASDPKGPFYMCYAVSTGPDPLGPYYRYAFERPLFPDYPRPAIWPDGYYIPTSTGDDVIEKHACVADRQKMLKGLPATEQCVIIEGVNFLNNADLDGRALPPPGAPNIMLAAGGTQLKKVFEDDEIYAYQFHVDWSDQAKTKIAGPVRLDVAPYHYLCDGQLTKCVSQPGTEIRLDAQGDKLMQRLVYRNLGSYESLAVVHSINTNAGGGGVRWYEFRLDNNRNPKLYQQGTYAPDRFFRWMGSIGIDHQGNIGIGYSFGGDPYFAGQRFAGRLASDRPGSLTFRETVLAEGEAAQTNTLRWQDYTTTAMDPSDDCTFWYVGDFLKRGADGYSTRIGAFRMPGCLHSRVAGSAYYDLNHDGHRESDESGLPNVAVQSSGSAPSRVITDGGGDFNLSLPADIAYEDPVYTITQEALPRKTWRRTRIAAASTSGLAVAQNGTDYTVHLADTQGVGGVDFGNVCTVRNSGAKDIRFWSKKGSNLPSADWTTVGGSKLNVINRDGSQFTLSGSGTENELRNYLLHAGLHGLPALSAQIVVTALNITVGNQDGKATVHDPVMNDWIPVQVALERANSVTASGGAGRDHVERYRKLLEDLNRKRLEITPSKPEACGPLK